MRQPLAVCIIAFSIVAGTAIVSPALRAAGGANPASIDLLKGLAGPEPAHQSYIQTFREWTAVRQGWQGVPQAASYQLGVVSVARGEPPLFAVDTASEFLKHGGLDTGRGMALLTLVGQKLTNLSDIRAVLGRLYGPVAASWLMRSATEHAQKGDIVAAGAFLEALAETTGFPPKPSEGNRELADLYARVGWQQWNAGRREDATRNLDRALVLMPDNEYALIFKGATLLSQRRADEGMVLTKRALKLYPNSYESWHFWGAALRSAGETASAERALRRAVDLGPRNPWVRLDYARVLSDLHRDAEALNHAQEAVELATDHDSQIATLRFLGDLYWSSGDVTHASDAYRRLVALDPSSYSDLKQRVQPLGNGS